MKRARFSEEMGYSVSSGFMLASRMASLRPTRVANRVRETLPTLRPRGRRSPRMTCSAAAMECEQPPTPRPFDAFDVNRLEPSSSHHLRDPAGIVPMSSPAWPKVPP